jgi:thiol-disulfide isomerase/thioredoxin
MTQLKNLFRDLFLAVASVVLLSTAANAAEDYTWSDLDGRTHNLSDYRGQWVLVNYWATWCPPCLEELPELEIFHADSKGSATVLGVNTESISGARLRAFVEDQSLSYPIMRAAANPKPVELIGSVEGLPTSFLVTPEGEVVARQVGPITADAIRQFIDRYESR